MKIIVVTGSVCSGKTKVAKRIAKEKDGKYIDVNKVLDKFK